MACREGGSMSTLEQEIMAAAKNGMQKAITDELVGYNKPLSKMCTEVMEENAPTLKALLRTEVAGLINSTEFRVQISKVLNEKLARILISKMGGELEKRVNELKQNAETRAKITLAVSGVIDELIKEKL
jgi:hypothetical protein